MSIDRCQFCGAAVVVVDQHVHLIPFSADGTFRYSTECPCCGGGERATIPLETAFEWEDRPRWRQRKRRKKISKGAGG